MSIQDLGALGELVAAIATVVTLAYLALQIRQNTKSPNESRKVALAQTYQGRAALAMDAMQRMGDPEFGAIRRKYRKEREANGPAAAIRALTPEEQWRYSTHLNVQRTYTDNTFYQYQLGLLDDEYAEWGLGPKGSLGMHAQDWLDWDVPLGRSSFQDKVEQYLNEG